MIRVGIWAGHAPALQEARRGLLTYLADHPWLDAESADLAPDQSVVDRHDVLIALAPPDEKVGEALADHVARGAGLIACLGAEPAWPAATADRLLGIAPERLRPVPETELILRTVDPDHPITRRLDTGFPVVARAALIDGQPDGATVLWETSWRLARPPIAYTRTHGAGRVVALALDPTADLLADWAIRRFFYRSVRFLAGIESPRTTSVAMIGYGAIGREHAEAIQQVAGLDLAVVCDRNPARRSEVAAGWPGVRTRGQLAEVLDDPSVDLAIVSTPPNTHAEVAAQLLRAGKHVVVEKPFCLTTAEADGLIALATETGRVLTVYQNRRWDPDFVAIREVIAAGEIGDVFYLEAFVGGYGHPCDYWHSDEAVSGGVFYDWGSHYIDWILNLVPDRVVGVRASSHKRIWHDVTNADQAGIDLRFAGGAEARFIHSDLAAALKPKWYILGTRGAIVADWRHEAIKTRHWTGDLIEESLAASETLPVVRVSIPDRRGGTHVRRLGLPPAPAVPFHRNLADHLQSGEPLAVPAASARRNIAVLEAATMSARDHARVVAVDI